MISALFFLGMGFVIGWKMGKKYYKIKRFDRLLARRYKQCKRD